MSNTTETAGVNPGTATSEELVDISFNLPASLWEALKEESVNEMLTTDDIVVLALKERFATNKAVEAFEDRTGVAVEDLLPIIHRAGIQAVMDYTREQEEITIPLNLAVVPSGSAPIFLNERTARYVRECCKIADVDADEWVEGWIGTAQVNDAFRDDCDVNFSGMCFDLVEELYDPEVGPRPAEEKAALYEKFREVRLRYLAEVAADEAEEEAAASAEGGAA